MNMQRKILKIQDIMSKKVQMTVTNIMMKKITVVMVMIKFSMRNESTRDRRKMNQMKVERKKEIQSMMMMIESDCLFL